MAGKDRTPRQQPPAPARAPQAAFPPALLDGYRRYRSDAHRLNRSEFERLAVYGQQPDVMVVSCCDSRVTPESIFGAAPGELFVLRNIANLVPPHRPGNDFLSTSAALEFAVQGLKVHHIVVLAHCRCGGVKAFLDREAAPLSPGDFVGSWMTLLRPALALRCDPVECSDDPQLAMEYAGVRQSLDNLRSFPFIRALEDSGQLRLHGAWFDIGSGELRLMDPATGRFLPATDTRIPH